MPTKEEVLQAVRTLLMFSSDHSATPLVGIMDEDGDLHLFAQHPGFILGGYTARKDIMDPAERFTEYFLRRLASEVLEND